MPDVISNSDLAERRDPGLPGHRLAWVAVYDDGSNLFQYGQPVEAKFFDIAFPKLRECGLVDTHNGNKLVMRYRLPGPFPKVRPIYRRRIGLPDQSKRWCVQVIGFQRDEGEKGKVQEVMFFDDQTARQIGELRHGWKGPLDPDYRIFGAPHWFQEEVGWGMVTILEGDEAEWRDGKKKEESVGPYLGARSDGLQGPGGILRFLR